MMGRVDSFSGCSRRPTRATVSLDAVRHNVRTLSQRLMNTTKVLVSVKADGYGHGAIPVARAALDAGATWLGVATVDEGRELRQDGIAAPVLVHAPSAHEEYPAALAAHLTLAIGSHAEAESLAERAREIGVRAPVHIEVDTGMHRFGVPSGEAVDEILSIAALPHLDVQGIYMHFSGSEEEDKGSARRQTDRFREVLERLRARGITVPLVHASNTGGALALDDAEYDMVRVGIGVYGYHPGGRERTTDLRPALRLATRLARVETVEAGEGVSYNSTYQASSRSVLGLVPLGYADGLPRLLSNRGSMLVGGQRCPIVGRVCMDQTVLDLSRVPTAAVEDPVVVIGTQGDEAIWADEIAVWAETIAYEILARLGPRVPRDYVGGDNLNRHSDG